MLAVQLDKSQQPITTSKIQALRQPICYSMQCPMYKYVVTVCSILRLCTSNTPQRSQTSLVSEKALSAVFTLNGFSLVLQLIFYYHLENSIIHYVTYLYKLYYKTFLHHLKQSQNIHEKWDLHICVPHSLKKMSGFRDFTHSYIQAASNYC